MCSITRISPHKDWSCHHHTKWPICHKQVDMTPCPRILVYFLVAVDYNKHFYYRRDSDLSSQTQTYISDREIPLLSTALLPIPSFQLPYLQPQHCNITLQWVTHITAKDVWQWTYTHIIHWPYHVPPSPREQVAKQNSMIAFQHGYGVSQ